MSDTRGRNVHGMARLRRRFAWWLRMLGDTIDPTSGPRQLGGATFTFEHGEGLRFRPDGRGCELWFMEQDYDKAHEQADTRHVRVRWSSLITGDGPPIDYPGGDA